MTRIPSSDSPDLAPSPGEGTRAPSRATAGDAATPVSVAGHQTPAPSIPGGGGAGYQSPAGPSINRDEIPNPAGDADPGEADRGTASPGLTGQDWRDRVKAVQGQQAAARRNGRGRYRAKRAGDRFGPGMARKYPGGDGAA